MFIWLSFFKSSYYAILSTGPKRVQRHIIYCTAETTTMMMMNETETFTTMALALEIEEKKFLLQSAIAFFILFIVHFSLPVNITVFQTITLARFGMLLQLRNHFFFLLSFTVCSTISFFLRRIEILELIYMAEVSIGKFVAFNLMKVIRMFCHDTEIP